MSEIDIDIETLVEADISAEVAVADDTPAPSPEGEAVDYVPFEATVTGEEPVVGDVANDLERLHDVPVELAVEIGRTRMTIGEALALGAGSIITLNRLAGEPVDLLVNGKQIARGEVVVIDEEFGLRVTEVVTGRRPKPDLDAD